MISDLSLLQAFKLVSDEKSFSAAAKKLHLGLPQTSKKIQKLEEALGTRLFHRTTRSVSLTQDGLSIYPKLVRLLEDLKDIESTFENKKSLQGKLKITCITSVAHMVLAKALVNFQKAYPMIDIEFDVNDGVVDLIDTQTDIAIRVEGPQHADYMFKRLVPNRLIFVASPSYLKQNGTPKSLNALQQHSFLRLDVYRDCKILGTHQTVEQIKTHQRILCQSGMMLTTLCTQGAGIALRSTWDVAQLIRDKRLVHILPNVQIEDFGVLHAVVPNRRLMSGKVRAFLDFIETDAKSWPR